MFMNPEIKGICDGHHRYPMLNMSLHIKWTAHILTENCTDDSDANKALQQRLIVLLIALAEGLKIVSVFDKKRSAGEPLT